MRGERPLRRAARRGLALLWGAGGGAGLFLLLCAAGVVDPAALSPAGPPAGAPQAVFAREDPAPFRAAVLSPEALDRAAQAARGRDGVMVTMKGPDGALAWVSDLPLAIDCGASFAQPARNEALRAMNATEGLYTVARISCLRDSALALARPSMALERISGAPWRDEAGAAWLDPTDQGVQTYCIGLCRELADLGFDEILLTDCRFPAGPGTEDLAFSGDREAALETFCRRLQRALADTPVRLSVEGTALTADSGQTEALLASFPGRVWAGAEDRDALAAFAPAVIPAG